MTADEWKNTDPRLSVNSSAAIIVYRHGPDDSCPAVVVVKHGWDVFLKGKGQVGSDDEWDDTWWWVYAPFQDPAGADA